MKKHALVIALLILLASCSAEVSVESSQTSSANADEANFGNVDDQLFWTYEQKVAGFRNMEKIGPTRLVSAGGNPYPLPRNETDLGSVKFSYEDAVWTIDQYVETQKIAGIIVIRKGEIIYERYELGNTEESRWVSYSVAKSVTSMLVGAAIKDGYIDSVDEMITDYLPRLKGTPYGQSSIRNVLQMSSGVEWNEDYADPESDINTTPWETLAIYDYLGDKPRASEPGEVFGYNTAETNLVGNIVRSAVGNNLSTYLSEKIWKPFGMEHDAYWALTEPGGGEFGGCCINATLRDYARIGLFAMNNGVLVDGTRVLPNSWMEEATTPSKGNPGYGYLWWLRGGGVYAASGIFGQRIQIYPAEKIVIALHSARDDASNPEDWRLLHAAFAALASAASNPRDNHE
ncbi:MAG: serine hydrolase [Woeseiaceae bacterium]|nr:serine hydrolase [Woeseiaceae bacterium]